MDYLDEFTIYDHEKETSRRATRRKEKFKHKSDDREPPAKFVSGRKEATKKRGCYTPREKGVNSKRLLSDVAKWE